MPTDAKYPIPTDEIDLLESIRDVDGLLQLWESDNDPYVAEALGRIGDPRAIQPLIAGFSANDGAGENAMNGLYLMGEQAVEPLVRSLMESDPKTRMWSAATLWLLRDDRAVIPLIEALGDEDVNVRLMVAGALGRHHDERAIRPLLRSLRTDEEEVQHEAEIALDRILGMD